VREGRCTTRRTQDSSHTWSPKRQYVAANSLLSTTQSASNLAGPALGGAMIQVLSAPVAMVVDAVSFLVTLNSEEPSFDVPRQWRPAVVAGNASLGDDDEARQEVGPSVGVSGDHEVG